MNREERAGEMRGILRRAVFITGVLAVAAIGIWASPAVAAEPTVLGQQCEQAADGSYRCGSDGGSANPLPTTSPTWDGVPIDVSATLPDPETHGDGPYPLVMMFHGYSQGKVGFTEQKQYADKGYAVFAMTARGFHNSCGNAATADDPGCEGQYVRLLDNRYEVRDAQFFAGLLVDEGWVQPNKIAAYGGSYGGGMSMALAALKDRVMLPDGSLTAWNSPTGTPLSLAVATPIVPWTDLAYAQIPNGRNLDYLAENPYDVGRFGIIKQSLINGLFRSGNLTGRYAPAGTLPAADLAGWLELIDSGEPYGDKPGTSALVEQLTRFHSSYYISPATAPAPLLISNGFTDDLFPADEAIRFYNRSLAHYPDLNIGLLFADLGHGRSQSKADVGAALGIQIIKWIDFYLGGIGQEPVGNVTAFSVTCPAVAPSGAPREAATWAAIFPGEITIEGGKSGQVIAPNGGDPAVAVDFNPVLGKGACASTPGAVENGSASYESAPVPAGGFTLIGSPTVISDISVEGTSSQIAARLVDVAPDGTKKLVARQLYRPNSGGYQVFQLHPTAWRFDEGHVARLELLPKDAASNPVPGNLINYGRPSDGQQPVTVKDLVLRLPVAEKPGALAGLVAEPAAKVLPDDRPDVSLASGYSQTGSISMAQYVKSRRDEVKGKLRLKGIIKAAGKHVTLRLLCPAKVDTCGRSRITVRGATKSRKARGNKVLVARASKISIGPGRTRALKIRMKPKARKLFIKKAGRLKSLRVKVTLTNGSGKSVRTTTLRVR